jgi:hypothetical protein
MPRSPMTVPPLPRAPLCAAVLGLCALFALAAARPAGAQTPGPVVAPLPDPPMVHPPSQPGPPTPVPVEEAKPEKTKRGRQPLTPLRMGIGIPLVALGGISMILGATHMAVPVFVSPADRPDVVMSGCISHGVYVPCAANRYAVGGLLFGLGGTAVLAGTSILVRWPW